MSGTEISAWALCRLPSTQEPVFLGQKKDPVEELVSLSMLNGREGFLLAPFETGGPSPILLIRPDIHLRGWEAIEAALVSENLPFAQGLSGYPLNPERNEEEEKGYEIAFQTFLKALCEERFHKLVLSRTQTLTLPEGFSPWHMYKEACRRYPRMMVYLCYIPQAGLWLGCSPEIILSGTGTHWHTVALAGTLQMERGVLPARWDEKNRREQQFVSEYLRTALQSIGELHAEKGPYAVQAGELAHLKTDFLFDLTAAKGIGDVLQLLHPTPAVCGLPKKEALGFILSHETHRRRYYSGVVGWISATASTELYVNLRCMEVLSPDQIRLYAGGGILPQSGFCTEWKETESKMKTLKRLIPCIE